MAPKTFPLSKAEFARRTGLSRARITQECSAGGSLAPALLAAGKLNALHACIPPWCRARGIERKVLLAPTSPPKRAAKTRKPKPKPDDTQPEIDDGNTHELLDLTVREVIERFGSVAGFEDWLDSRKKIAEIARIELGVAQTNGQLISRELVQQHVFGYLETMSVQLLRDTPKTVARRVYALARSNAPLEEAEKLVRELISQQLEQSKHRAVKALKE